MSRCSILKYGFLQAENIHIHCRSGKALCTAVRAKSRLLQILYLKGKLNCPFKTSQKFTDLLLLYFLYCAVLSRVLFLLNWIICLCVVFVLGLGTLLQSICMWCFHTVGDITGLWSYCRACAIYSVVFYTLLYFYSYLLY